VINRPPGTKVWLACRPVSMRKGFDGLAAEAAKVIGRDPLSGAVFVSVPSGPRHRCPSDFQVDA
jgi:transposase